MSDYAFENDMQKHFMNGLVNLKKAYWPPLSMLASLTKEIGELTEEIEKIFIRSL